MGVDWWKQLTFLFSFLLSPSPFSFLFFFLCHHPLWTGIVLCSQTKNTKQGEPEPQFNCCKQHLRSFHCHIECLEHQRTIDLTIACVLCQNKTFQSFIPTMVFIHYWRMFRLTCVICLAQWPLTWITCPRRSDHCIFEGSPRQWEQVGDKAW